MALKIACSKCGRELERPGGLLFSPPNVHGQVIVLKYHVCPECWKSLVNWIFGPFHGESHG